MRIIKSQVDRLTYSKTPRHKDGRTDYPMDIRWDDELPGFGVRVYPPRVRSGRSLTPRSYVVGYYFQGRWTIMTLGKNGHLTPKSAREQAKIELGCVAQAAGKQPAVQIVKLKDSA
jgi:hypothetical protein